MSTANVQGIRRSLVQGNGKGTPNASAACIDAETLAAWADGGLSKADAAAVELHLADCERCTAMLATFARTIPAAPATESLWKRWHLRWLVPAATAATVASLYVLIPRQPSPEIASTVNSAPTVETEQQRAAEPSATPQFRTQAPPPAAPLSKEQDTFGREESRRAQDQLADKRRADADANAVAQPQPLNETITAAPPTSRDADRAEAKVADAQQERFSPTPPLGAVSPAPASPAAAAAAAPPPPPAVSAESAARARPFGSAAGNGARTTIIEIPSPNPMTRWRVIDVGQVERSTNGGAQWQRATLPESATLTGGASPSPSICWLVGRGGAIYLTTDGLRFMRVPFQDRIDFLSIQAEDARRATVTTADGRTLRTEDQGATWIRLSP
jgi:hypothetical protein